KKDELFIKNVLGNVFMFIPYGFFCSYILKENKYQPILILTLIASISIETTQLMIGRVFDIDDIMLNTVGGMIGYYIYILFLKVRDFYKPLLSKEWVLNIIAILLLAGFIKILL
ncbi:VanZ family protein, partial [bacterium]|nr:VanZ family protein [bacterium]